MEITLGGGGSPRPEFHVLSWVPHQPTYPPIHSDLVLTATNTGNDFFFFNKGSSFVVPQKELPYDPVVPLPSMYPKELKPGTQRDICTPLLMAALFTIAKW